MAYLGSESEPCEYKQHLRLSCAGEQHVEVKEVQGSPP